MFICNCNGITRRQVEEAKRSGVRKGRDVYRHYDCEPCCGKCVPEMAELVRDEKKS